MAVFPSSSGWVSHVVVMAVLFGEALADTIGEAQVAEETGLWSVQEQRNPACTAPRLGFF